MPISEDPARVRAVGTVYWEAQHVEAPSSGSSLIKAIVGEDWIIERKSDGKLCFVLYRNSFHHPLPESARVQL